MKSSVIQTNFPVPTVEKSIDDLGKAINKKELDSRAEVFFKALLKY